MLTSSYHKRVLTVCLALILLIAGLSVVLYNRGPHVRLVQFSDNPIEASFTKGATMTLTFDRPLEQKDYTDLISVRPGVAFSSTTSAQGITLTFDESLAHGTEYTVSVLPDVYDRSNKKMQNRFESTFTTREPAFAYIERNYAVDYADSFVGETDAEDHVMRSAIGSEPEVVFSHPQIRSFVANREYAVVAVKEEQSDQLYTVNLETKEVEQNNLQFSGRIGNLTLSPRGQVVLFTILPDFSLVGAEYYQKYANRVESLNIQTGEMVSLKNEAGEYIRAFEMVPDNDGQVVLIQDDKQAYYAVSPFNDYEPILIGTYAESFGFNDSADEIIFREREEIVRYNIASATTSRVDLGDILYLRALVATNNSIFSFSTGIYNNSVRSDIKMYEDWESEPVTVWSNTSGGTSLVNSFSQSYDNNLFAIQQDPESCRFDTIGLNSKCTVANTIVFDASKQETIEGFRGFDLVWIP